MAQTPSGKYMVFYAASKKLMFFLHQLLCSVAYILPPHAVYRTAMLNNREMDIPNHDIGQFITHSQH